jgi:hypothetical protein
MMISTALLRSLGACTREITFIHSLMGDKPFKVTRKLCLAHYDKISWGWAAAHLLPAPAQEQYKKTRVVAQEQLDETYTVAREQLDRTVAAALEQYDKVRAVAREQHDKACDCAQEKYDKARAVAFADACLTASTYLSR